MTLLLNYLHIGLYNIHMTEETRLNALCWPLAKHMISDNEISQFWTCTDVIYRCRYWSILTYTYHLLSFVVACFSEEKPFVNGLFCSAEAIILVETIQEAWNQSAFTFKINRKTYISILLHSWCSKVQNITQFVRYEPEIKVQRGYKQWRCLV